MTEEEWRSAIAPNSNEAVVAFVEYLVTCPSNRKKRLLACACSRHCWPILLASGNKLRGWYRQLNDWLPAAIDTSEAFADGNSDKKNLRNAWPTHSGGGPYNIARDVCSSRARRTIGVLHGLWAVFAEEGLSNPFENFVLFARDIFGNPFRHSTISPEWLTWNNGTIPKLAQTIYDERRYDIMPILGDALEDAGCTDAQILEHCRGPGPHVRGCWVVDLILGKE